jgi:hypothetical protein
MQDPQGLDRILARGAARAAEYAEPKLVEMKRRIGFLPGADG